MGKFKFFFVTVATIFVLGLVFGCRQQFANAADKSWSEVYAKYKKEFDKYREKFTDNEAKWFRADLQYAHYYPLGEPIQDMSIYWNVVCDLLYNASNNFKYYKQHVYDVSEDIVADGKINEDDMCVYVMLLWQRKYENDFTCHLVRYLNPTNDKKYTFIRLIYTINKAVYISYIDVYKAVMSKYTYMDLPPEEYLLREYITGADGKQYYMDLYRTHKDTIWIEGKEY